MDLSLSSWPLPLMMLVALAGAAGALLPIPALGTQRGAWAYALGSTLATFAVSLLLPLGFDWSAGGLQMTGAWAWVPGFGLTAGYGIDAVSLWLILLTTFLMPIIILGSLTAVGQRFREFYFWLLLLEVAMIGTFLATDIIFFYVCFEFTLLPLFVLIGVFGSSNRLRAAKVFFLYTFTGSMLTFAGVLYVAWFNTTLGHAWTFDILALCEAGRQMSGTQQAWVLGALLAGFAVKVPLFPVHTWLPLAHTEAPTAGSVILAGVLLKLGTYGLIRLAIPMTPVASVRFAPLIAGLAIAGILYAALVCWVQKDVKKLIAYSSVSHLGFCVLGLFALDRDLIGPVGSVMYMINHGLSTGALFLCVGMIYERFHTREMAAMSGLAKPMPVWSFFMVFFVLASVGLPGLNGFVGEFMTLMGALMPSGTLGLGYATVAGFGMIFAAIYLLYLTGRVVFGPVKVPAGHGHGGGGHGHHGVRDLDRREIATLAPLAVACLALGLGPYPVLRSLEAPVAELTASARAVIDPGETRVADAPAAGGVDAGAEARVAVVEGEPLWIRSPALRAGMER